MSRAQRRLRYNAGFQKKRARVLAPRPTSKEISDRRLQAFLASDPRRQQQNDCPNPVAVAHATAARLREEEQLIAGNRPRSSASRCLPPLARQKKPPTARLGSASFRRPPPGRHQITAPVWSVSGQAGSSLKRKESEKMGLLELPGHFPGILDTMNKHKFWISHPDTKPPLRRRVYELQAAMPRSQQLVANSYGRLMRMPRPRAARTEEETACDRPPNDWYGMVCKDSLEQWSYCRRKIVPRHMRLQSLVQPSSKTVCGEACNVIEEVEPSYLDEPLAPLLEDHREMDQVPWWAKLFRIDSIDSPNYSWLYFANAASATADSLGKEFAVKGSSGLTRLYLDWVFCRLALLSEKQCVTALQKASRRSPGAISPVVRGRRPRSNPMRYRGTRSRLLMRSPECSLRAVPASAPARHLQIDGLFGINCESGVSTDILDSTCPHGSVD